LSTSIAEVPSASALQVLRRLGSIFTSVYETKLKRVFHFKKVYKAGKILLYVKRNKAISLGNATSKVENKFEGDNTPIVIQPPCYSASKVTDIYKRTKSMAKRTKLSTRMERA
ncbi:hypothetical protein Tco_1339842, partial [Tanacetum coccineum]